MSKTSRRHSRYASSSIGNDPNRAATASRSAARLRCCQSGLRPPGRRFGRSSARAGGFAELRGEQRRAAELAQDQILDLFGRRQHQLRDPGGSSVSGNRTTNPSSVHIVSTSRPVSARTRSTTAIDHGA